MFHVSIKVPRGAPVDLVFLGRYLGDDSHIWAKWVNIPEKDAQINQKSEERPLTGTPVLIDVQYK